MVSTSASRSIPLLRSLTTLLELHPEFHDAVEAAITKNFSRLFKKHGAVPVEDSATEVFNIGAAVDICLGALGEVFLTDEYIDGFVLAVCGPDVTLPDGSICSPLQPTAEQIKAMHALGDVLDSIIYVTQSH